MRVMSEQGYKVKVAKDLADLIPMFMSNRKKELDALRAALAAADFEQLRQIVHRMRGVGNSYGFELVSTIGKHIEDGAGGVPRAHSGRRRRYGVFARSHDRR